MGHLGNPTAFRLGIQKNWTFNFFVKNLHYSELFHHLINAKDYIYYYFTDVISEVQSSIFFSHFNITNILKKIHINIYIYCVNLEKLSYNIINKFYITYYNVYNEIKAELLTKQNNKKEDEKNYIIFSNLRDLSNSDLSVFYLSYSMFYQNNAFEYVGNEGNTVWMEEDEEEISYIYSRLKDNLYKKSILTLNHFKSITYYYVKMLIYLAKEKWNLKTASGNLKKKFKNTKFSKFYKKHKKIDLKKQKLWVLAKAIILKSLNTWLSEHYRAEFIEKNKNNVIQYKYFNKFIKLNLKKKIKLLISSMFLNRHKNMVMSFLINKVKACKRNLRDSSSDKLFMPFFDFTKNKKIFYNKKFNFNFLYLFLYFAKKVNFKKVKHSKTLKNKWYIMYKYLKMFSKLNFISLKKSLMLEFNGFFFIMSLFIYYSREMKKGRVAFNFRDYIYRLIYYGLYSNYAEYFFEVLTSYLKTVLTLLLNGYFNSEAISITYFLIHNASVSSQLIANYIAMKLRKNIPLFKILNPLKFELIRVSIKTRSKYSLAYMSRFLKKMRKNRMVYLKEWLQKYVNKFFFLMDIIFYKYYNNLFSGILVTLKYFFFKFNYKNKKPREKRYFEFMLITRFFYCLIVNKKYILKKKTPALKFIKNYKLTWVYPLLLNFNNNNNWKMAILDTSKRIYLNSLFYYTLKVIYNIFSYKSHKVMNTKLVYIGSFIVKNLINYRVIQDLWLQFNKFNLRNLRQKYIPKYKTSLYGFKILIKGRFSRKLRASKVVMTFGKVPLNTLTAKIDYTFLTMPLKNSAVGIKVYLYKLSDGYTHYKQMIQF